MKHIHHDMIVEWAKDPSRVVQFRKDMKSEWEDSGNRILWSDELQYRFKPMPKPNARLRYIVGTPSDKYAMRYAEESEFADLMLTFSGKTGKLIKAEVME